VSYRCQFDQTQRLQGEIRAGAGSVGLRLDLFLGRILHDYTRASLQQLILQRLVLVNGVPAKPGRRLRRDDQVLYNFPSVVRLETLPWAVDLRILFQDPWIIAVEKPCDMPVHPAAGTGNRSLLNGVRTLFSDSHINAVHRIDAETEGIVLFSRSVESARHLARQFHARSIKKYYLAWVMGCPPTRSGIINKPLLRVDDNGHGAMTGQSQHASTRYRVITSTISRSLLIISPLTGRKHQIRRHLADLGCPVSGDPVYGQRRPGERMWLLAWRICFTHPATGRRMRLSAHLPHVYLQPAN